MSRFSLRALPAPRRLPSRSARLLIALSVIVLGIAILGGFLYDGWHRLAYVAAFTAIGLGNLAWAVGSLIPDQRGGQTLRQTTTIFIIIMFITLPIALAYEFILN